MLGLLLIYFIGKKFYTLAGQYNKNQWGFAIAGVASYYTGIIIGGIILFIFLDLWGITLDETDDLMINLISIPIGLLACTGLYLLLEKNWERKPIRDNPDILDEEMR